MKRSIVILLALSTFTAFLTQAQAKGDVGSVDSSIPQSVKSTTSQIQQYSPQSRAVTITKLCEVMAQDSLDWGRSKLTCIEHSNGLIEIKGATANGTLSVFANADDKTVFEAFGSTAIQQYQNDLDQQLRVEFTFVNTGEKVTSAGVHLQGYYRVDARLKNGNQTLRVGFFDNLN